MEKYLSQCLESLIIPSLDDVEILVINDGSKDRTSEIGHEYEAKYPASIRVIDKPNGHYGSCINRGLAEATGKYIRVLDDDDSFDTDNFEKFITWLRNQDVDLVLSDYCIVDESGTITSERHFHNITDKKIFNFKEALPLLSMRIMAMHGVTFKRELLIKIDYRQTEGVAYTDQEWIFVPILNVNTITHFPHIIYRYLVGRAGQSVDKSVITKAMALQLKHFSKRLDDYASISNGLSEAKKTYAYYRMFYSMVNTFKCILFEEGTDVFANNLIEIDNKLRTVFPELYNSLNDEKLSRKLPFRFIAYWRGRYPYGKKTPILAILKRLRNL